METHSRYINETLASALIHTYMADFNESSFPKVLPSNKLNIMRLACGFVALGALVLMFFTPDFSLPMSII